MEYGSSCKNSPGDPVRLTTGSEDDFAPAWSPDGRFIAFLQARVHSHAAVVIMPAVGGPERELAVITFEGAALLAIGRIFWPRPTLHGRPIANGFLRWTGASLWKLTTLYGYPSRAVKSER
jgi:hypothetical protein